jgi:predicted DNA-binding transcriptional regulator YafY
VTTTSGRLLRLLSLLQARRDWTSGELAERLAVSTRTIRNDVARLRELGYPLEARPGVAGGYRLGSEGSLPPLLLDDDEAVAVAVGLRTVASGSLAGIEETSLRAMAKLHQVLPSRLRHRVAAVESATVPVPFRGPRLDPDLLTTVSLACRDHERLRFDYRAHAGGTTRRTVEPYRVVNERQRWYLFAWDVDKTDWRTFRIDRMTPKSPTGPRFAPRPLPSDADIAAHVSRGVAQAPWRFRATVVVHAPADHVRRRMPVPVRVTALGKSRCRFEPGSDSPDVLALYLGFLEADFEVVDAPELVAALRRVAERYARAADASAPTG